MTNLEFHKQAFAILKEAHDKRRRIVRYDEIVMAVLGIPTHLWDYPEDDANTTIKVDKETIK